MSRKQKFWVLTRNGPTSHKSDQFMYRALPSSGEWYTGQISKAMKFPTRAAAEEEAFSDEVAEPSKIYHVGRLARGLKR